MSKDWLYTSRWFSREIRSAETLPEAKALGEELEKYCTRELGEKVQDTEPDMPTNSGKDPGPVVEPEFNYTSRRMRFRGPFPEGGPEGMVVHFSAGRFDKGASSAIGTLKWGASQGFAFGVADTEGVIHLATNENFKQWGYHAGTSKWQGRSGMSRYLWGLEVANAGKLNSKNEAWFGQKIPDSQVRVIPKNNENQAAGNYHMFTEAQEQAIIGMALYLKREFPETFSFDMVLGHDEVAGPAGLGYHRKTDPGGSLSTTMPAFRAHLKALWQNT